MTLRSFFSVYLLRYLRGDLGRLVLFLALSIAQIYLFWDAGWRYDTSELVPLQKQLSNVQNDKNSWQKLAAANEQQLLYVKELAQESQTEQKIIDTVGNYNNITLISFNKSAPTILPTTEFLQKDFPKVLPTSMLHAIVCELELKGRYLDILALIQDLQKMPNAFFWQDFELSIVSYPSTHTILKFILWEQ